MKRDLMVVAFLLLGTGACQAKTAREYLLHGCDAILVGKLAEATPQGVIYTNPPTYSTLLQFSAEDVVWGPFPEGSVVKASHSAHQKEQPKYPVGTTYLVGLKRLWAHDHWEIVLFEGSTKENVKEARDARQDREIKERNDHSQTFTVESAVKADLQTVKLYVSVQRKPGEKDFEVFDLGKVRARGRDVKKVADKKKRYVYAELRVGDKLKSPAIIAPEGQFLEAVTFELLNYVADKTLKVRAVRSEAPNP